MKPQNQNKLWSAEDTDLLMNSDLKIAQVAKKVKRTKQACSMRRYTLLNAAANPTVPKKRGRPRTNPIEVTRPKLRRALPPIYNYEGKHRIATLHKLGWLTRFLLGVKIAA